MWPLALLLGLPLAHMVVSYRYDLSGRAVLGHGAFLVAAGSILLSAAVLLWALRLDRPARLAFALPFALLGLGLFVTGVNRSAGDGPVAHQATGEGSSDLLRPQPDAPIGAVVAFAGEPASHLPVGWLPCDGRELHRSDYPELYEAIGVGHGGDAIGTFYLPDLRGRFVRGVDGGAGRDPDSAARSAPGVGGNAGDRVGSVQDDQLGKHHHEHRLFKLKDADWVRGVVHPLNGTGDTTYRERTSSAGGAETRPQNLALYWIIRAR